MEALLRALGLRSKREAIVERLLAAGQITASEAMILLRVKDRIIIKTGNISSGAKVVVGEDNASGR